MLCGHSHHWLLLTVMSVSPGFFSPPEQSSGSVHGSEITWRPDHVLLVMLLSVFSCPFIVFLFIVFIILIIIIEFKLSRPHLTF